MPKVVQFSPHAPETRTFEKEAPQQLPAATRQAASTLIDDVYAAVMLSAGADDNTLSMALCRTQTEFNSRKAQLMQARLDEMVLRKNMSQNQKRAKELEDLVAKRNSTPPAKKFLRRKKDPVQPSPAAQRAPKPPDRRGTVPTPTNPVVRRPTPPMEEDPEDLGNTDLLLPVPSEAERMRSIMRKKRETALLKKQRAEAEAQKLKKLNDELKDSEQRQKEKKAQQLEARKQQLEARRQKRLNDVAAKERQLDAIRKDKSALKYQREQALRAKRRQDEYIKRVEMPELEQRKQRLAELRQQFDPMDHDALKRRERDYVLEMRADKLTAKEQRRIEVELNALTAGRHHTGVYHQKAAEEHARQRKGYKEKQDKIHERCLRRRRYAELAQEMFAPRVDESKVMELKERAEQPCHGWGWKEVAPRMRRGSHVGQLETERNRDPRERVHRIQRSNSMSSQESYYDERDEEEYYSDEEYGSDDAYRYKRESDRASSKITPRTQPATARSSAMDSALSVGELPKSRLSEYTPQAVAAPEAAQPFSTAHEPGGELQELVEEEGGRLHKLSDRGGSSRMSDLDALEQGLKEQSLQSSEYLQAIKSQLNRIDRSKAIEEAQSVGEYPPQEKDQPTQGGEAEEEPSEDVDEGYSDQEFEQEDN